MFNKRVLAVIKRELKIKLFSRTFIIMTLLIPVFMFGIIAIQALLYSYSGEQNPKLILLTESDSLSKNLQKEFSQQPFVKNGSYSILYETVQKKYFDKKFNEIKPDLLSEKLTGIVFVPDSALINKNIQYYSTNPNNLALFNKIKPTINKTLIDNYFAHKKLSKKEIDFAREDVDITGFRVSKEKNVEEEGTGNIILLFLFTFLLYMSLIFTGQMTMNSVVEEKNNKIVEVLLSSASSMELMTGKIMGTAIIGLIQMAIWISPVVLVVSTTWFTLPPEVTLQLNPWYFFYFLLNYLIALITFVGLFASVGAIFDNPQDAQSGIWPLLLLIMIPFFIALSMQSNPQSPIAKVAAFFPFASLIVMPGRLTMIEVPFWQIIVSLIINTAVMFSIFPLAGKIYRVGILITGKKPKWSEVVKWLKYKY